MSSGTTVYLVRRVHIRARTSKLVAVCATCDEARVTADAALAAYAAAVAANVEEPLPELRDVMFEVMPIDAARAPRIDPTPE
jgi:hypothetical protein